MKRVCITAPEGDGTQDAPSALSMVDVVCKIIKGDPDFSGVTSVIILSDNAGTYSADVFSVAVFDVVRSHGLAVKGIIHNEAQDGKTELDSWFYHFKRQLKKWMSRFKCAVLTPNHMAEAMEYSTGVKGMRFDIVRLKRNQLDGLFEDKEKCYGALKQRMKQALPSNLAEVRTAADGTNELFESSALPPFAFTNKSVQMVDRYMTEKDEGGSQKNPLVMGYGFFQNMYNSMKKQAAPPLVPPPAVPEGELMTGTSIIRTVPPPDRGEGQAAAAGGGGGGGDDDDDVLSSDEEADGGGDGGRAACAECGRAFPSDAFLRLHSGSKACRPMHLNNTAEARAVRALKRLLDGGGAVVHGRDADISHVAPAPATAAADPCAAKFPRGWAQRPAHGHSKGHLYMTLEHKEKIRGYFDAGEKDKGAKKSAALMVEALRAGEEGAGAKHYIPFVSEITPFISQLVTASKKGTEAGAGVRGREQATVPDGYHDALRGTLSSYLQVNGKHMPKTGPNSAHEQLKLRYPDGLPEDFPKLPAVQRYHDAWVSAWAAEQQNQGQNQGENGAGTTDPQPLGSA